MANQIIRFLRNGTAYGNKDLAMEALNSKVNHKAGQPVAIFYKVATEDSNVFTVKAMLAIGKADGIGALNYELIAGAEGLDELQVLLGETVKALGAEVEARTEGDKALAVTLEKVGNSYVFKQGEGVVYSIPITDEDNKNFLTVEDEGKTLAVRGMDTDKTITTKEIVLAGGPLAEEFKVAYPDGKLPANTNIQDLLMKLLCVEKWGDPKQSQFGSTSATVDNPTITFSPATSLVEVGQTVSVTVNGAASKGSTKAPIVSGMTYGYSADDDNTCEYKGTSITASVKSALAASDNTSVLNVTGKVTGTGNGTSAADAKVTGTFVATLGSNSVSASQTGAIYSTTYNTIPSYYSCSNLGNTNYMENDKKNWKKTPEVLEKTYTSARPSSSTVSKSVTAVYPMYTNGKDITSADGQPTGKIPAQETFKDGTKLPLTNGTVFAVNFAAESANKAHYLVYLHGKKITDAMAFNPTTNAYDVPFMENMVQSGTKTFTVQEKEITYDVWTTTGAPTRGKNKIKFTIANK